MTDEKPLILRFLSVGQRYNLLTHKHKLPCIIRRSNALVYTTILQRQRSRCTYLYYCSRVVDAIHKPSRKNIYNCKPMMRWFLVAQPK